MSKKLVPSLTLFTAIHMIGSPFRKPPHAPACYLFLSRRPPGWTGFLPLCIHSIKPCCDTRRERTPSSIRLPRCLMLPSSRLDRRRFVALFFTLICVVSSDIQILPRSVSCHVITRASQLLTRPIDWCPPFVPTRLVAIRLPITSTVPIPSYPSPAMKSAVFPRS